jgi:nucleotide-binding universal stress UspA family protein
MKTGEAKTHVTLKNILYLTDFSEPSEAALPFALAIARGYDAKVHALHVLTPAFRVYAGAETAVGAIEGEEESAQVEMQRVEGELAGLPYETSVERGVGVWEILQRKLENEDIDLIVLGTHGRTGAQKFLLGSIAEEIFRRSPVPVLTIGPRVRGGQHSRAEFRRILFATDFSPEAMAAAPYAISLAQENQARLALLHVIPQREQHDKQPIGEFSVTDTLGKLNDLVPDEAQLWCRPEAVVDYGAPGEQILEAADGLDADLIVLGVRDATGRLGAATHLERSTAHKVVAHAGCPVLTVRG